MTAAIIRCNANAHGIAWAAKRARKQGINIDAVLHALGMARVGCKRKGDTK